jgi:hypothetical protein
MLAKAGAVMMKKISLLLMSLTILVQICACSDEIWSDELTIVPGERVNGYYIGTTTEAQIRKSLGKPSEEHTIDNGSYLMLAYQHYDLQFLMDTETRILKMVRLSGRLYKTRENLRIGSSYADLKKFYGEPATTSKTAEGGTIAVYSSGISVEIGKSQTITVITIHQRTSAEK